MPAGTRLFIAITVILFLLMSGILGGLQWFQSFSRSDPAEVQAIADTILPLNLSEEFIPVKGADLSELNNLKLVSFEKTDDRGRTTTLNMTAMAQENFDGSKPFSSGTDWEDENFQAVESTQPTYAFQGFPIVGHYVRLKNQATQDIRVEMAVALDWQDTKVVLSLTGPADTTSHQDFQTILDSIARQEVNGTP